MPPIRQQLPGFLTVIAIVAVTLGTLWLLGCRAYFDPIFP